MPAMFQQFVNFLDVEIWRLPARKLRGFKGRLIHALRIFILSLREFSSDKCSLRASALTFYSLLSIVPVFAMAFGLAKGFGLDRLLKERLLENMEGQEEVMTRVITFSENLLQDVKGGWIAGIGILFLFWTVIKVLSNIETSFNDIWGVKKQRSLSRKFTDYLALMMIAPIFFIVASSATVFITSQVRSITEQVALVRMFGSAILPALKILPYAVFWGLLTYLYMFLPNTQIQFKSALIGGVVAGTVYQMTQWVYIHFQIGAANAGAIYGSLAALPLFLMWLQISWLIVLYGAELAFAHQNDQTFEFEPDCMQASQSVRKLLALRIAQLCVDRFAHGLAPLSAADIAQELEMPVRLARDLLHQLDQSGILTVTQGESERERLYQPARDLDELTVQFVLEKMEGRGTDCIPVAPSPELEALRSSLEVFRKTLAGLEENVRLKDLGKSAVTAAAEHAHRY